MQFFVHVALDQFGAEVLGRLQGWIQDRGGSYASSHLFVWAGPGEAPGRKSFWSRALPLWDEGLPLAWGIAESAPEVDRKEVLVNLRDGISSDTGWKTFQRLVEDIPRSRFGAHVASEPKLALVASLADPLGSSGVLGVLAGLDLLRRSGRVDLACRSFLAIGSASSSLHDPLIARRLAAQGLLDLEGLSKAHATEGSRPLGVFLVGEAGPERPLLDRASQVAVTAMAAEASYRSLESSDGAAEEVFNPFFLGWDSDGRASVGRRDRPFDPGASFSIVGGYRIGVPSQTLAPMLALASCRLAFDALCGANQDLTLEEALRVDPASIPGEVWSLMRGSAQRLFGRVAGVLGEKPRLSWSGGGDSQGSSGWAEFTYFEHLVRAVYDTAQWDQALAIYGEPRISRLPLADWEAGMRDLEEVIRAVLIPERDLYLQEVQRAAAMELSLSLDAEAGRIAEGTYLAPVGLTPHRVIMGLLGELLRQFEQAEAALQAEELRNEGRTLPEKESHQRLERLRAEVLAEVARIPNPFAVFLRYAPAALLGLGAIYFVPVDLGALDAPLYRGALGVALGAFLMVGMTWRLLRVARSEAADRLKRWLEALRQEIERADEKRRRAGVRSVLRSLRSIVEWFAHGSGPPPIPPKAGPILKQEPRDPLEILQASGDGECPQRALSQAGVFLSSARSSFSVAERAMLGAFQPSSLETLLPELSPSAPELVELLLKRALGVSIDKDGVDAVCDTIQRMKTSLGDGGLVPFSPASSGAGSTPSWRRRFALPAGDHLMDEDLRSASSGFLFFHTMERFFAKRTESVFSLSVALDEHEARSSAGQRSDLRTRYAEYSVPTVQANAEAPHFVLVAATSADPMVGPYRKDGDSLILEGEDKCSMVVQVQMGLSAHQVVFYPNEVRPTTPIGLARKTQSEEKPLPRCLQPAI